VAAEREARAVAPSPRPVVRGAPPDRAAAALAAAGFASFAAGAVLARRPGVSDAERQVFSAVNGLPGVLHVPVWTVMQLGSLGGVAGTAAVVARTGHSRLAARVAVTGTATWLGAKAVKRLVRRARPGGALGVARVLGREQAGLGYPSGHAAVAATLGALVVPALPPRWRTAGWATALAVGPARVFVGAHLPLDVGGGIAFGLGVAGLGRLLDGA
jgi:membrane-associated phospholipid phosphatase